MLQKLLQIFFPPQAHAVCAPDSPNAAGGFNLWECFVLNPEKGTTVQDVYSTPSVLINVVVTNVFLLAGIGLFIAIVYAGFKLATSPQSSDKSDSKDLLKNAAIGFMVMFSAYWIIQIIEILTGVENII